MEAEKRAWSLEFGAWSLALGVLGVNLTLGEDIGRGVDRSRMRALCIKTLLYSSIQ